SRFDDGEYAVRLASRNGRGQAAIDRRVVTVRNVRLASPANNDVRRGGVPVEFRGTVFGEGRTFAVSWGLGPQPSAWFETGVTLVGGGRTPVVDGSLATWDPAVAGNPSFVTFRLEARQEGRWVGDSWARMVHFEPRLRSGWPLALDFREDFPEASWREFVVADLDADGRQEIVLVDHGEPGGRPPRLKVLGADGREIWGRELPAGAPEFDAPVAGDIDGDGRLEVFVDTGSAGQILGFDAKGVPLSGGWPATPGGTHFGKMMADLDGDGALELVALSDPPADLVGTPQRRLVVLGADGQAKARWTFQGCGESVDVPVPELVAAAANLDDDAALELVAVDGCLGVSAFDLARPEGPIWTAATDTRLVASPVAGDLDGDGREEVVIGGVRRDATQPGGLHVFGRDGRPRSGGPSFREENFHGSAALADLDGDDRLEIVVASWDARTVHVVGLDGFELSGWPLPAQSNASTRSIPVIGDVDGDGMSDVVLASPGFWIQVLVGGETRRAGGVRAWRRDGSPIDFHPLEPMEGLVTEAVGGAAWNRLPPAALADLDGDGRLDVVAGTIQDRAYSPTPPVASNKSRSSLYAWDAGVAYAKASMAWPMYRGSAQRAGRYVRPPKPNRPPEIRNIPDQTVATGGAFRPLRLDRYVADPDGSRDRLVWEVRGARELKVSFSDVRQVSVEPPSATWEGTETLEFVVRDPAGAEDAEQVVFSVRSGYRPPVAETDDVTTNEETPVAFDPLANDRSPTSRPLRVGGVSDPAAGVTRVLADGRIEYEPAPDFFGVDAFEYTLVDDDGGLTFGEVRVKVDGVPDAPVTEPDRLTLDEDTTGEVELLENDRDPDGDSLILASLAAPAKGTWESLGPSRFRFVPAADWSGVQTLEYTVRDGSGLVSTGEVSVLVRPVNDPPRVADQEIALNRNRSADVFYDATDADGDTLRFTIVDPPAHGILLSYPTIANYEPEKGYSGSDRFTYTVTDGRVSVGPATVSLRVGDANNAPEVESVDTVTAEDQDLPLSLGVRDADGDAVTLRVVGAPEHGELSLDGTNAVYRPFAGFLGEDAFRYRAADGIEDSEDGVVRIRVTDENTPPSARSEVLTVGRNRDTAIALSASDKENNPLRFEIVAPPSYGVLEGVPPRVTYRPRANFRGLDRLQFQASDRRSTSEVAVVHLLVRDPNVAPVTTNQVLTVAKDTPTPIALKATDGDGHALRVAILEGPRHGRVYGEGVSRTYRPNAGFEGVDSFTYKAWDGFAYSGVATVSVYVQGASTVPISIAGVRVTGEGVELSIRGGVASGLRVEVSHDLVTWEMAARVPGGAEIVRWVDAGSGGGSARFYRVAEDVFGAFP
ncbi:MAG: tandem-95 repeat protein, partial [Verrucomicrobiales bacterium]|nr:tandem-95 repeat protein [Verrucomicrobiales bacterium]